MDDINDLKKLAGVTDKHGNSMGENMSVIGSQKGEYQKKHNVEPGTDEWFQLWFAAPGLTGENPMPKGHESVEEDAVDDVKKLKTDIDKESK